MYFSTHNLRSTSQLEALSAKPSSNTILHYSPLEYAKVEVEGIRQRYCPKKTWWDCVENDMESLGLSQKDAQSRNKWRRIIKGAIG